LDTFFCELGPWQALVNMVTDFHVPQVTWNLLTSKAIIKNVDFQGVPS